MTSAVFTQILITIISSGTLFGFFQFLITRYDKKKNEKKKSLADGLRKEFKANLDNSNEDWKKEYCDKHFRMIQDLAKESREGLQEREAVGRARYEENKEVIEQLQKAVLQLVENDTSMKEQMAGMNQQMEKIGDSLMGLSHEKIMCLCDKAITRGAITSRQKATIKSVYDPYRKLGGNGDCKVSYEIIDKLPVVSEDRMKEIEVEVGL